MAAERFLFIAAASPILARSPLSKMTLGCSVRCARPTGSSGCRSLVTKWRMAAAVLPLKRLSQRSRPRATSCSRAHPSYWISTLRSPVGKDRLLSDERLNAYIFQCAGDDLFTVSHDMTGANLPRASCSQGWILRGKSQLAEHASVPAHIGYYIWRDSCWTQRKSGGTHAAQSG
jgi:hypothetical protein